ncbi:hypothetical protein I3271_07240 [Photobacterium leiognathi]|uniref:hypothetical protein n=1 Tax=Photobacterium leiognathi TaxID=553611 RepID=UPI001EE0C153|nr:hypothetical protein [Photobacterium leiognathi]MCG3884480.1 hypothetical protein [Photobacterium leiognathi]
MTNTKTVLSLIWTSLLIAGCSITDNHNDDIVMTPAFAEYMRHVNTVSTPFGEPDGSWAEIKFISNNSIQMSDVEKLPQANNELTERVPPVEKPNIEDDSPTVDYTYLGVDTNKNDVPDRVELYIWKVLSVTENSTLSDYTSLIEVARLIGPEYRCVQDPNVLKIDEYDRLPKDIKGVISKYEIESIKYNSVGRQHPYHLIHILENQRPTCSAEYIDLEKIKHNIN